MIHTNRWKPDTCSHPPCIIEYSWDDMVPSELRAHVLANVLQKCAQHSGLSDNDLYTTLTEENPRKNNTLRECLENGPSALFDIDENGSRTLKNGITFDFSWSGVAPNRVLTISFTGITLTALQKTAIQTRLDTRFGAGKVILL